jgi:cell division initiation protein
LRSNDLGYSRRVAAAVDEGMEEVAMREQRRADTTTRLVSPRAVREFTAPAAIRGYDRDTVDDFLKEVAASYEATLRDLETLRQRLVEVERVADESDPAWADDSDNNTSIEALRRELRKYREREHAVGGALVYAQKSANELRSTAERELKALRKEAAEEGERQRIAAKEDADRIVLEAHAQAKKVEEEAASERSVLEAELDRLRALKKATQQDLSQFLTQAIRGLEESRPDDQGPTAAARNDERAQRSAGSS